MRADRYTTLADIIRPRGEADRRQRALIFEDREISYAELDARWGEAVHAVVVPHPGANIEREELLDWARARIAGYKLPRTMETVSALPKNAAGKILRREVRARVHAALQSHTATQEKSTP